MKGKGTIYKRFKNIQRKTTLPENIDTTKRKKKREEGSNKTGRKSENLIES